MIKVYISKSLGNFMFSLFICIDINERCRRKRWLYRSPILVLLFVVVWHYYYRLHTFVNILWTANYYEYDSCINRK